MSSHIKISEDHSNRIVPNIIIHEMRMKTDNSSRYFKQKSGRPNTNHQNTKNTDLVTFDPSSGNRVSASSSQFYKLRSSMP